MYRVNREVNLTSRIVTFLPKSYIILLHRHPAGLTVTNDASEEAITLVMGTVFPNDVISSACRSHWGNRRDSV